MTKELTNNLALDALAYEVGEGYGKGYTPTAERFREIVIEILLANGRSVIRDNIELALDREGNITPLLNFVGDQS